MPTKTDDDLNVGQQHADDLFNRGTDAADRDARQTANEMPEAQRARTLRRLEEQAAKRDNAGGGETAADETRQRESRGQRWTNKLNDPLDKTKRKANLAKRKAKRWIAGIAITAIMTTLGTIFAIIPHRLDVLSKQMEHRLYSRVEDYVSKRSDKMVWRYLAIYVFGNKLGIQSCMKAGQTNFTVHSDCFYRENRDDYPKTKLGQMYKTWKENRLERRVLPNQSIHYAPNGLRADGTRGPTWVVTLPDGQVPINPDNPEAGMTRAFTTTDITNSSRRAKTDLYNKIMDSLKNETKSSLLMRARASIHLKNKYGLTRCLFYCDLRDRIDEKKVNIKQAWQGFLAQRIFGGINARAGLFIGCMFQGSRSCTEDNTEFRTQYQGMIDKLKTKYGDEKIEGVIKIAEEYGKFRAEGGNFTKFISQKILTKIASKVGLAGASSVVNAIPIVGQIIYGIIVSYEVVTVILLAYNIYTFINSAQAQYAATSVKAGVYTAAAATMDTANDESRAADGTVFSGAVRAAQSESVSPEKSFLWNAAFIDPKGWGNPNVGALFAKAAYAQEDPTKEYPHVCDDEGNKIDEGQVFCPSWRFDYPTPVREFARSLPGYQVGEELANSKAAAAVQEVANEIVSTIDAPFEAASAFAYEHGTPKDVREWVDKNFAKLTEKLSNYMFAVPVKDVTDFMGTKLYDAWWLGKDWLINDMLRGGLEEDGKQFGTGARVATEKELTQLEDDYRRKLDEDYQKLSLWDKIFSHTHERTFVSQLALALPGNTNQTLRIVSPATAYNLVSNITRGNSAHAIAPNAIHGGIPQYIHSVEGLDSDLRPTDNDKPCPVDRATASGEMKSLGDDGVTDRGLGRAEYTTENICLLDDFVIGLNTDYFTNVPLDPAITTASSVSGSQGDGTATGQFAWPIPENDFWHTTSCYRGPGRPDHYGLDMQGHAGNGKTKILAADAGTVVTSGFDGGAGNYVAIRHGKAGDGQTYYTMYMHFASRPMVKEGDKVTKGQQIGVEGSTGQSTGPHLHFTLAKGAPRNSAENSINPLIELKKAMPDGSSYKKGNGCPVP